jgi:hypothetical protein
MILVLKIFMTLFINFVEKKSVEMQRSWVKFLFFHCFRNNFIDCNVYRNVA